MDAQLAEIYGTPHSGDDLEKVASAELLMKIAAENDIDIDSLSDEQIAELVTAVEGGGGQEGNVKVAHATDGNLYIFDENDNALEMLEGEVKVAQAQDGSLWVVDDEGQALCPYEGEVEGQGDTEFQEKVAESDFLGRVMAHAYEQERREIEKAAQGEAAPGAVRRGVAAAGRATGVSEMISGIKQLQKARGMQAAEKGVGAAARPLAAFPTGKAGLEALKGGAKRFGKRVALPLALGGTALAAYRRMKKGKEKKGSVEIVDERAYEILKQAGWVDAAGNVIPPQEEKVASAEELEVAALQRLEELGYPVEWNR